jgi:transposase
MIYASLNAEERTALETERNTTKDAKWYRRLKVIDLSAQGRSVSEIAGLLDVTAATIRTYIRRFNQGGLAGLRPDYDNGRPAKLTWTQAEWQDLLAQAPSAFELLNTAARNWTQALLCQYLSSYHQVSISQATLSKYLRAVGIRWRRAKVRVHSPDPLYLVKRQRIAHLQQMALAGTLTSQNSSHPRSDEPPKPAFLVFLDSTDLHWCPDLGSTYAQVASQQKIDSPGVENPWYALFGSLVYPSGEGVYTIHERKRTAELLAHLEQLFELDPEAFWFVVIDNASAHTTAQVQAFADQNRHRLELVFLPTYSPHLNLIERLWHFMRGQLTRNHFYASLDALAQAAVAWLNALPFAHFSSLMGIDDQQLVFVAKPFE